MAETLGSLIDKISIGKIRESKIASKVTDNPQSAVDTSTKRLLFSIIATNKALEDELDELVAQSISGAVKTLTEPKNKLYYDASIKLDDEKTIGSYISDLFEANQKLWELEDMRRDKSFSDDVRLRASDMVADFNQKRNLNIDKINELFEKMIIKNS